MRFTSVRYLILASSLLVASQIAAALDSDPQAFIAAQDAFEQSLAGDEGQTKSALEQFQALVDSDPAQPLFLAYLGSTYTLKARDAWMPWTRMRNVEKGLEMIDKALAMLGPEHDEQRLRGSIVSSETRLVAIATFLQVPGFLNRLQTAKDLLIEALDSPVYTASAPLVKGRFQLWAAEVAKREENPTARRTHLEKAVALLPPGRFADQARQQLVEAK